MFNITTKTFQFGGQTVTLETGKIARQASGAVTVTMGNSKVLATAVGRREASPNADFFPLTVNYQEKTYAAGRIPGGFFKREGRPTEKETLTSRLIDRPIRPLFPKGFLNEVQVICTVISADKDHDPDIAAMIGASAALAISGIPFAGPIAAARVGLDPNAGYMLNPSFEQLQHSALDMVVAGTRSAVLMVESEANELSEDQMLGAVLFAQQEMRVAIDAIEALKNEAGKPDWEWEPVAKNENLTTALAEKFGAGVTDAYQISGKVERYAASAPCRTKPSMRSRAPMTPTRRIFARHSRRWKKAPSETAFSMASRASTAATPARCGRSRWKSAYCPRPTARRCSPAAKPKPSLSPPWAPCAIRN